MYSPRITLYGINKPVLIASSLKHSDRCETATMLETFPILVSAKRHLHGNRETLSEDSWVTLQAVWGSWVTLQSEWGLMSNTTGCVRRTWVTLQAVWGGHEGHYRLCEASWVTLQSEWGLMSDTTVWVRAHEWHYSLSEGSWVTLQVVWGQFTLFSGSVSSWSVAPMSTGPSRTAFLSDLYEKVTFRPPSSSEPLPPSSPETKWVERETQDIFANHHMWTTGHICAWMLLSNQNIPIWAESIMDWGNYVTVLLHQRMQH